MRISGTKGSGDKSDPVQPWMPASSSVRNAMLRFISFSRQKTHFSLL
jgi:hypothetical protein